MCLILGRRTTALCRIIVVDSDAFGAQQWCALSRDQRVVAANCWPRKGLGQPCAVRDTDVGRARATSGEAHPPARQEQPPPLASWAMIFACPFFSAAG